MVINICFDGRCKMQTFQIYSTNLHLYYDVHIYSLSVYCVFAYPQVIRSHQVKNTSTLNTWYHRNFIDRVKQRLLMQIEAIEVTRQRGCPKKTWWDCVGGDMECLDTENQGEPANPSLTGKWWIKLGVHVVPLEFTCYMIQNAIHTL